MAVCSRTLPDSSMCQSVINRPWNRHQQAENVIGLPRNGQPRSTVQRPDHLPVIAALRNRTQNTTASAAFPRHRSSGHYPNNKKPSTRCSSACWLSEHCATLEFQPSPGKERMVLTPLRVGLWHSGLT